MTSGVESTVTSNRSLVACAFCHDRAVPSTAGDDDAEAPGLAAWVAVGPGAWEDEEWLADLRREPLLESLMADGTIAAAASAGHAP